MLPALGAERDNKNPLHTMIPYFQIPTLNIFGLTIHAFEVITSLGIYFGIRTALSMAKKRNLPEKNMIDVIWISIVAGFFGAHAVHVLLYQRDFTHPEKLLQLWNGISSTGGFLCGGIAAYIYFKKKNISIYDGGDCLIPGVMVALFFGRIGCFTVHDHPGALTTLPWGVAFPSGVRHDLGFEEAVYVGIFLAFAFSKHFRDKLNQTKGNWMIACTLFYGCMRMALDNLRAEDLPTSDTRYFGHTPAQYICVLFVILALAWWRQRGKHVVHADH